MGESKDSGRRVKGSGVAGVVGRGGAGCREGGTGSIARAALLFLYPQVDMLSDSDFWDCELIL